MKINRVWINNYRSHGKTCVTFGDYTVMVGANGTGKSSVFYALEWFFEGGVLEEGDFLSKEGADGVISVSVEFANLSSRDRELLGEYGRGDSAYFTRTSIDSGKKSKVFGNSIAGPGFHEVRKESRVTHKRVLYKDVRGKVPGLPELVGRPSGAEIDQQLADWEGCPENKELMENVSNSDANHLFGINGRNVMRELFKFILIPASVDIAGTAGASGKGGMLSELIGAVVESAAISAREEWKKKYSDQFEELIFTVNEKVERASVSHAEVVNKNLSKFIPGASIAFSSTAPDWSPKGVPLVTTKVDMGSYIGDLGNHGHGTQRAVMMAMLQSLAVSFPENNQNVSLGEDAESLGGTIFLCFEEPEIYQHPIRARSFARVLSEISDQNGIQVSIATHSPFFVRPSQFDNLRRFGLVRGITNVAHSNIKEAAFGAGVKEISFTKDVERKIPTVFSEGFFADGVVLVEGDTDKVFLEAISEKRSFPFDALGVAVIQVGGKNEIRMARSILDSLEIPCYVVFDADFDASKIKYPDDEKRCQKAHESNKKATEEILAWLCSGGSVYGPSEFSFGESTVVGVNFTAWKNDLESELQNWPSFMAALRNAGGTLGSKKAMTYRAGVMGADIADMPDAFSALVEVISGMSGGVVG